MRRETRHHLTFAERDTRGRFHEAKRRAQGRMDRSDLSNDEFMGLLLDVYQLHLRDGRHAAGEGVPA